MIESATHTSHLGLDGPDIGALGIGTWSWGDRMVWGYGKDDYTDSDIRQAFMASIEHDIKFFDTAEVYGLGRSEKLLGQFIKETADRDQLVIASKFFPFPWRLFPRRAAVRALRGTLRRLQLDHIDLYQIHWPSPLTSITALLEGMAQAVEEGLTRHIGVSNFNIEQTREAHAKLQEFNLPLASNQIEYSLIHRQPEFNGLLDLCRELGVTVIAYSPLGMGLLTGKYTPDNPPQGTRSRKYSTKYIAKLQPLIETMREIGHAHGDKTPAQVAINWTIAKGTVPIPGAKNKRQATDNVEAANWRLTDDEIAALDEASQELSI